MKIRFCGFGGQGIILSGYIFGVAGVSEGNKVLQTQSYGSESRGGQCRSDVIISKEEIYELAPSRFDVLVAFSQAAYDTHITNLKEDGILIVEADLVDTGNQPSAKTFRIKAVDIAYKKFGRKIMANMIMMGFICAIVEPVSKESIKNAILENVTRDTDDISLQAFEEGFRLGEEKSY